MLPLARRFAVAAAILPAFALTACNSGAPQPAGGVSKGEAEALAEAADMLDETRTLPPSAIPAEAAPEAAATQAAEGRQR